MKSAEHTSSSNDHGRESNDSGPSTIQVLSANQFNLPTKVRSRRKINAPKLLIEKDIKSSENIINGQSNIAMPSFHDRALNRKVSYVPIIYGQIEGDFLEPLIIIDIFIFDNCRKSFLVAFPGIKYGDGVHLSGSIVQLITHGLPKGSLWNTWSMLDWVLFQD